MKRIQKFLLSALLLLMMSVSAWADAPGKNGARTIVAASTVINQYTSLVSVAVSGLTGVSLTVSDITQLNSSETAGGGPLAAGDVVLLYQPRGATIDTTNTPTYGGDITYGNAGNYELRTVRAVSGNTIALDGTDTGTGCTANLKNTYSAGAQVIRVPQYSSLTVNGGASVVASPWNGTTGGVVAALVQGALTVNGSISVNGQGFRGGILDGTDRDVAVGTATFVSDDNPAGGAKGEGIASGTGNTFGGVALPYSNPGGNFDIGAPANGGGGGGSHNGGGGGGANAAAALTPYCTSGTSTYTTATTTAFIWCGQGVMPAGNNNAWQLDPGYKANSNAKTSHVGGGRGGYTYSSSNQDATTAAGAPGMTAWGGDYRRALGGWGGRPLLQTLSSKLFFGGGGGAGANNPAGNTGGAGGAGGGVILIQAGSLSGTGSITANGSNGASTTGGGNDGPGGAGAGGTIVLRAGSGSGSISTVTANGGAGGNQSITTAEAEGPGGGGGGGLIALTGASATTQQANGGTGGTTNGPSLTEFPRNGATDGGPGRTGDTAPELRTGAASCTLLAVSKNNGVNSLVAGGTTSYTLTVVNSGPSSADGTVLRDPAVTGLNCTSITCSSVAGGAACPAGGSTTIAFLQGATGIAVPTLPANSTATFTLNCNVTATGQ